MLNPKTCQKARLSRDPRFDGTFFIAVKTTGIYCRPICPVKPPKEQNVEYFNSAIGAANAGFRPCLRCRPDSAPGSPAWKGIDTTVDRAIHLIDEGALQNGSLIDLSDRLGIGDRYLRQLFKRQVGVSPKSYALYQQCLFAKQLLHQTSMTITDVALASGFNSLRRFNDCFQKQLKLTPSQVRKAVLVGENTLHLQLFYRPPYNWEAMRSFLSNRAISGLEWCDHQSYGRSFEYRGATGYFTARHVAEKNKFDISVVIDDLTQLKPVLHNIRRILDLDVDIEAVDREIALFFGSGTTIKPGLRLPGIWSVFEAGIRAILGQQISVVAARNLVSSLVSELGERCGDSHGNSPGIGKNTDEKILFPNALSIASSELQFLKIPNSRKQTLRNLAEHYIDRDHPDDPQQWLPLKGIGPWTVDYAKLRGLSNPDIYLGGDLGVKKAAEKTAKYLNPESVSPWRSYLTLHLWSQL